MASLHISLWDFYSMTPIEVNYAMKAYLNQVELQNKLSWEQTRLQIYYQYLLTPSNQSKLSYKEFRRQYIPLSFDEDLVDNTPAMSDETFAQIVDIFKEKENKVEKKELM